MIDKVRSEAVLFWGFVAHSDDQDVTAAFGWHDRFWQFELAHRLKIDPPEQIASDRKRDEWNEWRALLDDAIREWGCTFSWYGTETHKRWLVGITQSFHIADGPTALSIDTHLVVPEEPWRLKIDAFTHLMHIPRDPTNQLGWKLVARDKAFIDLPNTNDQ